MKFNYICLAAENPFIQI